MDRQPSDHFDGRDPEKADLKVEAADVSTEHASPVELQGGVQRRLKTRHLSMIALGGTIGTGLFVGSGGALANGGPLGLFMGYCLMSTVMLATMVALGEMVTLFPITGAFTHYASRWVDPALGFAVGYNFCYSACITVATEISAAATVVQYWDQSTPVAVYITVFFVTIGCINFFGVRWFGETEFWLSAIKVVAVVVLIILGLIIGLGGGPDDTVRFGFVFWKNPGAFNQLDGISGSKGRFLAFWATMVQAAFSYLGTETVALTAGEAANPRRAMPTAIRRIFWRILLFYILATLVLGWLVPFNDPRLLGNTGNASSSPWVIGIEHAGIRVLPSIINAVILVAAYSAGNSNLYVASRSLYGLAIDRKAPRIFAWTTKGGLPVPSLVATAVFGALAYLNVSNGSSEVFDWLSALSAITGLLTWATILVTFLRFQAGVKYHGIDRRSFAYTAPLQPWLSYWGLFMIILVVLTSGFKTFLAGHWSASTFISDYICLLVFFVIYTFWKVLKRPKIVKVVDMDMTTGRRELDEVADREEEAYKVPKGFIERTWDSLW